MKIKITEIEATANDLRACNSVADGILNVLKNVLNPYSGIDEDESEADYENKVD